MSALQFQKRAGMLLAPRPRPMHAAAATYAASATNARTAIA